MCSNDRSTPAGEITRCCAPYVIESGHYYRAPNAEKADPVWKDVTDEVAALRENQHDDSCRPVEALDTMQALHEEEVAALRADLEAVMADYQDAAARLADETEKNDALRVERDDLAKALDIEASSSEQYAQQRDRLREDRDDWKAEVERMRPVVHAANLWEQTGSQAHEAQLGYEVRTYRAASSEQSCCRNPVRDPGHTRRQETCGTCGADWAASSEQETGDEGPWTTPGPHPFHVASEQVQDPTTPTPTGEETYPSEQETTIEGRDGRMHRPGCHHLKSTLDCTCKASEQETTDAPHVPDYESKVDEALSIYERIRTRLNTRSRGEHRER